MCPYSSDKLTFISNKYFKTVDSNLLIIYLSIYNGIPQLKVNWHDKFWAKTKLLDSSSLEQYN